MTDSRARPQLFVLAGPNGSGKTTWLSDHAGEVAKLGLVVHLNPDAIARERMPSDVAKAAGEAGREVVKQSDGLLERRESFGFETTLSGRRGLRVMNRAREAGYEITLVYIATPRSPVPIAFDSSTTVDMGIRMSSRGWSRES